jgi:hypothetical protein
MGTPVGEFQDGARCLARKDFDSTRVPDEMAFDHRVREMVLPRIGWIDRSEGGVDATCRQHRVRILPEPLADDDNVSVGSVRG